MSLLALVSPVLIVSLVFPVLSSMPIASCCLWKCHLPLLPETVASEHLSTEQFELHPLSSLRTTKYPSNYIQTQGEKSSSNTGSQAPFRLTFTRNELWGSQPRMNAKGFDYYLQEVITWREEISTSWGKEKGARGKDQPWQAFAAG